VKPLIAIALLACALHAQSLGEVARQSRQKRDRKPSAQRLVTDENLVRAEPKSSDATLARLYREFKETVPQPATDHDHAFWARVLRPQNRAVPEEWRRLHTDAVNELTVGCSSNPKFTLPAAREQSMQELYNRHNELLRDLRKRYQQLLSSGAGEAEMQKIEYEVVTTDIQAWQMFYDWTWVKVDCATLAARGKREIIN